ncbi:hypothetical protein AUEXF2481DRAFT_88432 [Aureobasidium subglaciale EXF-2481]|uniref:Uncharacterized protein n=1 Tax=Aureobasidium subglaciale (strain EXF-2481) TaxID=1043005 RepID=A0A074YCX0_AURSE|nr:uncharacterized protein AUEXF2481DRAFT_88432 [Aureobasidium subglaciale EXF-2481]KEQ95608.1 hypothetical protein AUEXF2481DRAFT_88432 [Aureobasidium subglaciale EXF-2481]
MNDQPTRSFQSFKTDLLQYRLDHLESITLRNIKMQSAQNWGAVMHHLSTITTLEKGSLYKLSSSVSAPSPSQDSTDFLDIHRYEIEGVGIKHELCDLAALLVLSADDPKKWKHDLGLKINNPVKARRVVTGVEHHGAEQLAVCKPDEEVTIAPTIIASHPQHMRSSVLTIIEDTRTISVISNVNVTKKQTCNHLIVDQDITPVKPGPVQEVNTAAVERSLDLDDHIAFSDSCRNEMFNELTPVITQIESHHKLEPSEQDEDIGEWAETLCNELNELFL